MTQEIPKGDHLLAWVWEPGYALFVIFMDGNLQAANNENYGRSNFEQSAMTLFVDFNQIAQAHDIRTVMSLHGQTVSMFSKSMVSFDKNNSGDSVRPETDHLLNILRSGHFLRIETYGASYADDLNGVGAAIDQFPACFAQLKAETR